MNTRAKPFAFFQASVGVATLAAGIASCGGGYDGNSGGNMPPPVVSTKFTSTNLVSDGTITAAHTDAKLVNAWGLALNPDGFVWVANNETSTSTLYDGNGVPQTLVVAIPAGNRGAAKPTGIALNGNQDFKVTQNGVTGASPFIFAGQGGSLGGWSPAVILNAAVTLVDGGADGFGLRKDYVVVDRKPHSPSASMECFQINPYEDSPESRGEMGFPKHCEGTKAVNSGNPRQKSISDHAKKCYASGARGMREVVSRLGCVPDAIVCGNDLMAIGCLDTARHEMKLNVPGALSITGFDGVAQSSWLSYNLTTLRQPMQTMAIAASDMLGALIRDSSSGPARRVFSATVVEGATARLGPAF